ncbi:hypothetical protein F4703DRAFT_1035151 [Phycomyces blakesleeanus]
MLKCARPSTTHNKIFSPVQFILTDHANKCNCPIEYTIKRERTFWIDRVFPLLQTLGDKTGFVGFEWCETIAYEWMEFNTVPERWVHGNVRYLDGFCYYWKGRSKTVMKYSSSPIAEKMGHTLNDTIKNMNSSIAC